MPRTHASQTLAMMDQQTAQKGSTSSRAVLGASTGGKGCTASPPVPAAIWAAGIAPNSPLVYLSRHYIRAKEYLEAIVASTSDAICTTDLRGRIIFFNPGAEKMLGLKARDVVGLSIARLYEGGFDEAKKIMKLLMKHGSISNYETVLAVGDRKVPISMSASLLKDKDGKIVGTLGISKDITERVELERRLRELSISDNLTGLFNQRHFQERIAAEIQRARRQRDRLSLLLIDLDRLKEINDHQGHLQGDVILRRMGKSIQSSIRAGVDSGFRYGGDEFVLILPGLNIKKAEVVARRIQESLSPAQDGRPVTFSYGIAMLRPDDAPEDLLRRADDLMYKAKHRKKRADAGLPA